MEPSFEGGQSSTALSTFITLNWGLRLGGVREFITSPVQASMIAAVQ